MPSDEEVTERAGSVRAMTGLTETACQALLPHCEQAFVAYLGNRTIDGHPRTSRRYSTYATCPLPTMADKLLLMLTYLKQNPIQEVQGQLFGMSQSNTNKWIHLLHPVLNEALAAQPLLPARTADELAAMLARPETEEASTFPLVCTMGPNDPSNVRKILRTRKNMTAARRRVTRAKTSS
jgi:hypothetical protein